MSLVRQRSEWLVSSENGIFSVAHVPVLCSGLVDARNTALLAQRMMTDGCLLTLTRSLRRVSSDSAPCTTRSQSGAEPASLCVCLRRRWSPELCVSLRRRWSPELCVCLRRRWSPELCVWVSPASVLQRSSRRVCVGRWCRPAPSSPAHTHRPDRRGPSAHSLRSQTPPTTQRAQTPAGATECSSPRRRSQSPVMTCIWGWSLSPVMTCLWGRSLSPVLTCLWGRSRAPVRTCLWGWSQSPVRTCLWGWSLSPVMTCIWGRSQSPVLMCLWGRSLHPVLICLWGRSLHPVLICLWGRSLRWPHQTTTNPPDRPPAPQVCLKPPNPVTQTRSGHSRAS